MFQYSNGGYRDHAPRQQDNSNVYRGHDTGADKENLSIDVEDYYPTRDADHYQQNYQNYEVNRSDPVAHTEIQYADGSYPEYDNQNSDGTEDATDLEEDNVRQRNNGSLKKFPPKPAPKPLAYFQARVNRNRIFSRQESSEHPYPVDSLDHMRADQDLSPPVASRDRPTASSSSTFYTPRERTKSNQSNYDSNKSGQSSGDLFDRSQSAFSISSRTELDRSTLDMSTLSRRDNFDRSKNFLSTKSSTGSILVNRDAVTNSRNDTLNHSSLSTRSTTPGRDSRSMIVSPSHGVYRVTSRNDVVSSRGPYGDANRSVLSNQSAVVSEQNKSILSQNYSIGQPKTPTYMQNGTAHPVKETPLDTTIHSHANLSRAPSFTLSKTNLFNQSKVVNAIDGNEQTCGIRDSLVSLGLVCLISLVLIILGTQLLYKLNAKQFAEIQESIGAKNLLLSSRSYESMLEVSH